MIKYVMTAAALKFFSLTPQTKHMYRQLGNTLGQRRRIMHGLDRDEIDRAKRMLAWCEKYQIAQPGNRLLEIGTGWIHWDATVIRLFYDVSITLFDIWDNRQLAAYKRSLAAFDALVEKEFLLDEAQCERVHGLLQAILKAPSFDEIYNLLGFEYVVDPSGVLKLFQNDAFDALFSCNVLEHVDRTILPEFVRDFHRTLKPGGYSIHQIDPGDHLAYYDPGVSFKNYLRYSDRVWRSFFENEVQYFNRVQSSEWLQLFREAGFTLVDEELISVDISNLKIDDEYQNLSQLDLACIGMRVIHRKANA